MYFEAFDPKNINHHSAASGVYSMSIHAGTMLPLRPGKLAELPYSLLAFKEARNGPIWLGHAALVSCENGLGTVGGLVVDVHARRQGIGLAVVTHLLETATTILPELQECQAFANEASLPVFLAAGGIYLGERQQPSPTGCNAVVDLTPALQGPIHVPPKTI